MTVLAEIILGSNSCERAFVECNPPPQIGDLLRICGRICKVLLVVRQTTEAECHDGETESGLFYSYQHDDGHPGRIEIIAKPVDVSALAGQGNNIVRFDGAPIESEVRA